MATLPPLQVAANKLQHDIEKPDYAIYIFCNKVYAMKLPKTWNLHDGSNI